MEVSATSSSLNDIEYLARSPHRVIALSALVERPLTRAGLMERTDVSRSTVRRTLRAFEARHWIRREGQQYEATQLGAFVAAGMAELLDRLETERALRDIWHLLPAEASGFTVECWTDAVVTTAEPADPYRPVNRFLSLLRETDRFRFAGFDLALLEPSLDELCRRSSDSMDTEIIDPPDVVDRLRSTHPERTVEALHSGSLTVRTHDDLPPYGLGVFDDRVAVIGYNSDSGTVRVMLDTDAPAACDWVASRYSTYRRESDPVALEPATW